MTGARPARLRQLFSLSAEPSAPPTFPSLAEKMSDLFTDQPLLQRLPMEDADVSYAGSFPLSETPEQLLRDLIDEVPWRSESITILGRKYLQPRLIA